MPNIIAFIALILWPLIAAQIKKRNPMADAIICLILLPYLFLPVKVSFDLPALPSIDKTALAGLVVFFLFFKNLKEAGFFPQNKIAKLLIIGLFISIPITILHNSEPLIFKDSAIPGLKAWDAIGLFFMRFTDTYVPFIFGYHFLKSESSHKKIITYTAMLGLIYFLPMAWEVRMSPQLHAHIYGFFPHDFGQQIRDGGYRPVVFLGHGLLVAFFSFSATIAAYVLMKDKVSIFKIKPIATFLIICIGLVLCKTASAYIYAILFLSALFFLKNKTTLLIATYLGLFVLLYPYIRDGITPQLNLIGEKIAEYNEDRAQSLTFRFDNENILIEKANQKQWFGWGSWGRNLIYDDAGKQISVIDGVWIIVYGGWGYFGYLCFFGLLIYPIFSLHQKSKKLKIDFEGANYSTALVLILTANIIDFIPNSSLSLTTFMLAGALLGRSETINETQK